MHLHAFRIAALSLAITIAITGLQWTLSFAVGERLYPVDPQTPYEDPAARLRTEELRGRSEEEDEEREEEEKTDDDTSDKENTRNTSTLPRGGIRLPRVRRRDEEDNTVNPFVPALSPAQRPSENDTTDSAQLAAALDARGLTLAAFTDDPSGVRGEALTHCKALVERTLAVIPERLTAPLSSMTLFFNERSPRGMANSSLVELRCGGLSDREIVSVLVHELGHIADLGAFRGSSTTPSAFLDGSLVVPIDDLSVQFYELSWVSSDARRASATRDDFISGYAMTNPFEDFAESFIAYILHGNDFRALAKESSILQKKYEFLKTYVFEGVEYEDERSMRDGRRVWDVTLVEYDLDVFFAGETARSEAVALR